MIAHTIHEIFYLADIVNSIRGSHYCSMSILNRGDIISFSPVNSHCDTNRVMYCRIKPDIRTRKQKPRHYINIMKG
jgi:hypothetical protein